MRRRWKGSRRSDGEVERKLIVNAISPGLWSYVPRRPPALGARAMLLRRTHTRSVSKLLHGFQSRSRRSSWSKLQQAARKWDHEQGVVILALLSCIDPNRQRTSRVLKNVVVIRVSYQHQRRESKHKQDRGIMNIAPRNLRPLFVRPSRYENYFHATRTLHQR